MAFTIGSREDAFKYLKQEIDQRTRDTKLNTSEVRHIEQALSSATSVLQGQGLSTIAHRDFLELVALSGVDQAAWQKAGTSLTIECNS